MLEGQSEVLEAAGGPEVRLYGGGGGRHNAPLLRALTVVRVVLHTKVVSHLVSHGGGHEADDLAVPHAYPARELVGADGTFQGFTYHSLVELNTREELGIVVGMLLDQTFSAVVQEVGQRYITVRAQCDLVIIAPDHHADQRDVDVERGVERVGNICHVLALAVHLFEVAAILVELAVVDHDDELDVAGPLVCVPRTLHVDLWGGQAVVQASDISLLPMRINPLYELYDRTEKLF